MFTGKLAPQQPAIPGSNTFKEVVVILKAAVGGIIEELIQKAIKDIEAIKITIDTMKVLWDHIATC